MVTSKEERVVYENGKERKKRSFIFRNKGHYGLYIKNSLILA